MNWPPPEFLATTLSDWAMLVIIAVSLVMPALLLIRFFRADRASRKGLRIVKGGKP